MDLYLYAIYLFMALKTIQKFNIWIQIFGKEPKPFSTIGQFKKIQAVNLITNIGIAIYLFLFLTMIGCEIVNTRTDGRHPVFLAILAFIPSIAELSSVFIGIVLGFYYQEADKGKTRNIERLEIYRSIKEELEYNKNILADMFTNIDYGVPLLLKTTSWEIYKEKIGEFKNEPNSNLLTNIYYNIMILNEMTKMEPIQPFDYNKETINSIKIKLSEDYYSWKKDLTEKYKKWNIDF